MNRPPRSSAKAPNPRIMLYSHDSWGLGHLRRTLAIAHALNRNLNNAALLVVSGSPSATSFPLEKGIEIIKLPSVTKDANGHYVARQLRENFEGIVRLRRALLLSAFTEFQPDLLIIDHQIVGLSEEILPLLTAAKQSGTYCVYGMRDVLDAIEPTENAWATPASRWALREGYDEIWIYGDEHHFNTASYYPSLKSCSLRQTYTGLITNGQRVPLERLSDKPQVLVTVGGGEDGGQILRTYLGALADTAPDWDSTVVTGPMLANRERGEIESLAEKVPGTKLHCFHQSIPSLMRVSDVVVSMAGYNTCAEFVNARCPAILIPRTHPRIEQLIRAQYLQASNIARCLSNPTSNDLIDEIQRKLSTDQPKNLVYPAVTGLEVVVSRCRDILMGHEQQAYACRAQR